MGLMRGAPGGEPELPRNWVHRAMKRRRKRMRVSEVRAPAAVVVMMMPMLEQADPLEDEADDVAEHGHG